jgi:hypothetical protein
MYVRKLTCVLLRRVHSCLQTLPQSPSHLQTAGAATPPPQTPNHTPYAQGLPWA